LVAGGGVSAAAAEAAIYKDFTVQYAKSGKSTCRGCENKIDKVHHSSLIIVLVVTVTLSCRLVC